MRPELSKTIIFQDASNEIEFDYLDQPPLRQ